jgi:hypothetical protein
MIAMVIIQSSCASSNTQMNRAVEAASAHKAALSLHALAGRRWTFRNGDDFLTEAERVYADLPTSERVLVAVAVLAMFFDRLDGEYSFRCRLLFGRDRLEIEAYLATRTDGQLDEFCRWHGITSAELRSAIKRLVL